MPLHENPIPTPVSLPPLAEQRRIVAEVERRRLVIQQTEATVDASLAWVERLRQSIFKQAFSGKLVPQTPTTNRRPCCRSESGPSGRRKPRRAPGKGKSGRGRTRKVTA